MALAAGDAPDVGEAESVDATEVLMSEETVITLRPDEVGTYPPSPSAAAGVVAAVQDVVLIQADGTQLEVSGDGGGEEYERIIIIQADGDRRGEGALPGGVVSQHVVYETAYPADGGAGGHVQVVMADGVQRPHNYRGASAQKHG